MTDIPKAPAAALFGLPDLSSLTKTSLTSDNINAILTVVSMVLRTLGIGGLADFFALLLKIEQAWTASNSTPAIAAPTATTAPPKT